MPKLTVFSLSSSNHVTLTSKLTPFLTSHAFLMHIVAESHRQGSLCKKTHVNSSHRSEEDSGRSHRHRDTDLSINYMGIMTGPYWKFPKWWKLVIFCMKILGGSEMYFPWNQGNHWAAVMSVNKCRQKVVMITITSLFPFGLWEENHKRSNSCRFRC